MKQDVHKILISLIHINVWMLYFDVALLLEPLHLDLLLIIHVLRQLSQLQSLKNLLVEILQLVDVGSVASGLDFLVDLVHYVERLGPRLLLPLLLGSREVALLVVARLLVVDEDVVAVVVMLDDDDVVPPVLVDDLAHNVVL